MLLRASSSVSRISRFTAVSPGNRPSRMPTPTPKRSLTFSSSLQSQPDSKSPSRPLYASQSELLHLPIPTLNSTFHKYLETLQPLLSKDAYARNEKLVKQFLNDDFSKVLQKRLEDRAAQKDSWLSEWWNEVAYMGYRGRIIPDVSYFYIHKRGLGNGQSQEERAAELVRATVEFKKLVDSEMLEPEKVKGGALCMNSYQYLFNAVRTPTKSSDVPTNHGSQNHHIVVLRNNRYFKVETQGRSKSELVKAFQEIKQVADQKGEGSGVGILTVDNRDLWTETRDRLISNSPTNKASIDAIDSAILLVCLDDGPAPSTEDARAWSLWAGGVDRTPKGKGWNRWFDKHQIIVDSNGETGFNGEHSMLDGTPTLRLNEFMLGSLQAGKIPLELPENEKAKTPMPAPQELGFELDEQLKSVIAKSKEGFGKEMSLQDLKMINFEGYGKELIKTHKISPDGWVQMIKQLAFTRLFGRPGITYESCQTRKYLLGRTEVIRSASNESKAFTGSMISTSATDAEREQKLRKAVERHIQYSVWASQGQGVDRHMFGLKKLVKTDEGETVPEVFTDSDGLRSGHWELSTSQLSSKFLDGWGYGEVVPDGYGLSYSILDNKITWCITTKNNDAEKFGQALCDAAEEIKGVLERNKSSAGAGSKL